MDKKDKKPETIMQDGLVGILEDPATLQGFGDRRIRRMDVGHGNYGTFYLNIADGQPHLAYERNGQRVDLGDLRQGTESDKFRQILSGFGRDYNPSWGALDYHNADWIIDGMEKDVSGQLSSIEPMWAGELSEGQKQLVEAVESLYLNTQLRELMAQDGRLRIFLMEYQPFFEFGITGPAKDQKDLSTRLMNEAAFLFVDASGISPTAYTQIGVGQPLGHEDFRAVAANIHYSEFDLKKMGWIHHPPEKAAQILEGMVNHQLHSMKMYAARR